MQVQSYSYNAPSARTHLFHCAASSSSAVPPIVLCSVISTSAGFSSVFRGRVIGGGQYGCRHAVYSTSWPPLGRHIATWSTRTRIDMGIAGLHPRNPRHLSWERSARVSQSLRPCYFSHMIASCYVSRAIQAPSPLGCRNTLTYAQTTTRTRLRALSRLVTSRTRLADITSEKGGDFMV